MGVACMHEMAECFDEEKGGKFDDDCFVEKMQKNAECLAAVMAMGDDSSDDDSSEEMEPVVAQLTSFKKAKDCDKGNEKKGKALDDTTLEFGCNMLMDDKKKNEGEVYFENIE